MHCYSAQTPEKFPTANHTLAKFVASIIFNQLRSSPGKILFSNSTLKSLYPKEINTRKRWKCKKEGEKQTNRGSQNLQIIMDKGQSQTKSNSTMSNTFSPNQTRTPSSAGEKAHSQKQLRDGRRLRHQSNQNSCRYLNIFGQVITYYRKVALTELRILPPSLWNSKFPSHLSLTSQKCELENASPKYLVRALSYWLGKIPKLLNSDTFLLLKSRELRFYS